jgi:hypothetical protein
MIIIIGLVLIAVAFVISLPMIGFGTVFPFVGDIIDVILAILFLIIGGTLLLVGVGDYISEHWWLIPLGFIIIGVCIYFKLQIGNKRR